MQDQLRQRDNRPTPIKPQEINLLRWQKTLKRKTSWTLTSKSTKTSLLNSPQKWRSRYHQWPQGTSSLHQGMSPRSTTSNSKEISSKTKIWIWKITNSARYPLKWLERMMSHLVLRMMWSLILSSSTRRNPRFWRGQKTPKSRSMFRWSRIALWRRLSTFKNRMNWRRPTWPRNRGLLGSSLTNMRLLRRWLARLISSFRIINTSSSTLRRTLLTRYWLNKSRLRNRKQLFNWSKVKFKKDLRQTPQLKLFNHRPLSLASSLSSQSLSKRSRFINLWRRMNQKI